MAGAPSRKAASPDTPNRDRIRPSVTGFLGTVTHFPLGARAIRGYGRGMKPNKAFVIVAALLVASAAVAQETAAREPAASSEGTEPTQTKDKTVRVRSLQLYHAGLVFALPFEPTSGLPGYGIGLRSYNFFNPDEEGGFYWYVFGTDLSRKAGDVSISDNHLAGIGWRKALAGPFGVDVGASAVVGGCRIVGLSITGYNLAGVSPLLGLSWSVTDSLDLGIQAEPVFMLYPFDEQRDVEARDYLNVSLYFAIKSFAELKPLRWHEPKRGTEKQGGAE